ncbi:MAG: hypothetical protein ACK58T_24275, partial [Phycisphaerae bacterium]
GPTSARRRPPAAGGHPAAPLRFLLLLFAGIVNREQARALDYRREENRILREQLRGRRLEQSFGANGSAACSVLPSPPTRGLTTRRVGAGNIVSLRNSSYRCARALHGRMNAPADSRPRDTSPGGMPAFEFLDIAESLASRPMGPLGHFHGICIV